MEKTLVHYTSIRYTKWFSRFQERNMSKAKLAAYSVNLAFYIGYGIMERISAKEAFLKLC